VSAENRSEIGDYLERPIILIGAGRSGSTLFARMLNAHPQIQFLLETDFLIARIWREVWDNRLFWLHSLNSQYQVMPEPTSARGPQVEIPSDAIDAAKERAARSVRRLFAELMQIKPDFAAWGFKEIWNGNPAVAQVPWSVYRGVFAHARWVHLVRDPFTFVQSSTRWNQLPLTTYLLKEELKRWQQVVEWSRRLTKASDFFEIRYEDLILAPKVTLRPILTSVRLDWHDDCERELNRRTMASARPVSFLRKKTLDHGYIKQIVDEIPGLSSSMKVFGYRVPKELKVTKQKDRSGPRRYFDLRLWREIKSFREQEVP
jgi:hypothetical protein